MAAMTKPLNKKTAKAEELQDAPHTEVVKAIVRGDAPDTDGVTHKRLKSFIERVERLEQEKAGTAEDIKEVYAEAKGTGFEPRIMRRIVKLRAMDPDKRAEDDELLELYKAAVGMN